MSVSQMRTYLIYSSNGKDWPDKVNRMSDSQVVAVYHSFLNRGKLKTKPPKPTPKQLTITDCFGTDIL